VRRGRWHSRASAPVTLRVTGRQQQHGRGEDRQAEVVVSLARVAREPAERRDLQDDSESLGTEPLGGQVGVAPSV
jgi:hypothetical protein